MLHFFWRCKSHTTTNVASAEEPRRACPLGLAELQNYCEGSMLPPVSFFVRQDRQCFMLVLSDQLRVRCSLSAAALKQLALSTSGAPAWGIVSWWSGVTLFSSLQLYFMMRPKVQWRNLTLSSGRCGFTGSEPSWEHPSTIDPSHVSSI